MLNEIVTTAMAVTTAMDTAAKVSFGAKLGQFYSNNKTPIIATAAGLGAAGVATGISIACCNNATAKEEPKWMELARKTRERSDERAARKAENKAKKESEKKNDGVKETTEPADSKEEKIEVDQMTEDEAKAASDKKEETIKVVDAPVTKMTEQPVVKEEKLPCNPENTEKANPEKIPVVS